MTREWRRSTHLPSWLRGRETRLSASSSPRADSRQSSASTVTSEPVLSFASSARSNSPEASTIAHMGGTTRGEIRHSNSTTSPTACLAGNPPVANGNGNAPLEAALKDFCEHLTPQEHSNLSNAHAPTTTDVIDLVISINTQTARGKARRIGAKFQKVLLSVQQFTEIVDTFIQSDPTVAALVWGSIKFAVLMASNFARYFEKIADMYGELGELCPAFNRLENLFPESQRLRGLVEQFYVIVIGFCGEVLKFLKDKAIKQFGRSLWKPFEVQYAGIRARLQEQEKKINSEVRICSESAAFRERQQMVLYRHERRQYDSRQENRMVRQDRRERERKHEALLGVISNFDHRPTFENLRLRRHRNTSAWLDQIAEFGIWLKESRACGLWIHGKPGSGKSTLATAAVDLLVEKVASPRSSISYFFCDFNDPRSLNAQAILASLIKQILSLFTETPQRLEDEVDRLFSKHYRSPDPQELFGFLQSAGTIFDEIYLIIDGLDECDDDNLRCLVSGLARLTQSSTKLKFIILSRHHINIPNIAKDLLVDLHIISLESFGQRPDVEDYVQDQLTQRVNDERLKVRDSGMLDEIKQALCSGCDGMFLWLTFQFHDICRQNTDDAIRKVLMSLPRGLDKTYDRIIERIASDHDGQIAKKIFAWLSTVRRPLTLAELQEAVAIELEDLTWYDSQKRFANDPLKMLYNCGALVAHNKVDDTVHFAHKTVLDYLRAKPRGSEFYLDQHEDNLKVAECCLTYLSFSDFETAIARPPPSNRPTALDVPISAWMPSIAASDSVPKLVQKTYGCLRQISKANKAESKLTMAHYLPPPPPPSTPLDDLGKRFALLRYAVESWLPHSSDITPSNGKCWSLIQGILIRTFAFTHIPWDDSQENNPYQAQFTWAIENLHPMLLELTLGVLNNREPPLNYYHYISIGKPPELPTHIACKRGADTLLDILLRFGFPVHNSSLHAAAREGHLAVVDRLLAAEVHVNAAAADGYGQTALQAAAEGGHIAVVNRLLAAMADVNAAPSDRRGRTALQAAAGSGHLTVVDRLLAAKAAVNAPASAYDGRTALQAAAEGGHLAVANRLLTAMADVNAAAAEDHGRTSLQAAAEGGHLAVVDRLLAAEADVNAAAADDHGRTSLQAAAEGGHLAVVDRLLAAEADVNAAAADNHGRTALQAAAEGGHLAVVDRLLAAKADVNTDGARVAGFTALQAAARGGHVAVVNRLLAAKADVNAVASYDGGRTALQAAAEGGHLAVVDRLLAAKADVNAAASRRFGRTALQAAVKGGHLAVVNRLLAMKADVNAAASYGDGLTALEAAAGAGHLDVVERLRRAGGVRAEYAYARYQIAREWENY